VVEVEDTGHGIAAEEQSRLFMPFEQIASSRKAQAGTGLGPAISRNSGKFFTIDFLLGGVSATG